jgi:NADH dehydrogenase
LPERVGRLAEGMRLVHVSALGADIHGGSAYLRSKACGEQRLLARAPTATIVRPSVVYGPSDHFVSRFYRLARWAPWGVPVPLAESLLAPVHVADVVSGLMAILTRLEAQGELYEFCGPQVLSLGEIVTLITQASGHHARPWALSSRASWWLASLGDRLPFLPLTRDEWRTLNGSVVCSEGSMGLRELGVCPRAFTTALNGLLPPPRLVG